MPVGIEAWFTQIPPITRAWLALAVSTSLAVVCPSSMKRAQLANPFIAAIPACHPVATLL
jgi:hypothetical protein